MPGMGDMSEASTVIAPADADGVREALGVEAVPEEAAECLRIESGRPRLGYDMDGDTVSLADNQVFVDGKAATWSAMQPANDAEQGFTLITKETLFGRTHTMMLTPHVSAVRSFGPIKVPKGQYFVLGDNRDNSNDSRFIGFISRKSIVGRATAVAFSLDREHHFAPRFDRFFKKLE